MKPITIFHLLLSLISLSTMCVLTSAYHEESSTNSRPPAPLFKQYPGENHDKIHNTFELYICEVTQGSPLADDVQTAASDLRDRKGWRWCQQQNRFGSRCTRMTNYGTASVSICGMFLSRMKCKDVAYEVMHMGLACRRNVGGKLLQGGKIMFKEGYISIYHS